MLTIVDTFSRFSPATDPRFSYRGEDVVQTLERICGRIGYPKSIRVDQGSEFVSRDLDLWAYQRGVVLDFSRPGKPTDNVFIESFNGKFRAECLRSYVANAPNCRLDGQRVLVWNGSMPKPLIIHTLTEKRAEILGQIKAYEAQIAHAKHDLAHVNATIDLFAAPEQQRARYIVSHGFFKKGEIADICVRHLGVDAELTTRELAERVMAERDLDISDTALRNSVVFKVVQALRHAKRRKLVRMIEKKKGMCVWGAGDAVTLRAVANIPSTTG